MIAQPQADRQLIIAGSTSTCEYVNLISKLAQIKIMCLFGRHLWHGCFKTGIEDCSSYPTWKVASVIFGLSFTPLLLESMWLLGPSQANFFDRMPKEQERSCTSQYEQSSTFSLCFWWSMMCINMLMHTLLTRDCWTEKHYIYFPPVKFWWSACVVNRELPLQKGDIVYIYKQIDQNWFEGEHHGRVGIFPRSYIEVAAFLAGVLFVHSLSGRDQFMGFVSGTWLILFVHSSSFHQLRRLNPKSHYHCKYWNMEMLLLNSTSMGIPKWKCPSER